MDQVTFVELMNACRVEQGLAPLTAEEEITDYREYLKEEEEASRYR